MNKAHLTAISRKTPSVPTRLIATMVLPGRRILDYGCGKGTDAEFLNDLGHVVTNYDPYYFNIDWWNKSYDLTICNYVLNVVESPAERQAIIADCSHSATVSYFAVRADVSSVKDTWLESGDGWITPKGTFQKFYTTESVIGEFPKAEILVATADMILFKIDSRS